MRRVQTVSTEYAKPSKLIIDSTLSPRVNPSAPPVSDKRVEIG